MICADISMGFVLGFLKPLDVGQRFWLRSNVVNVIQVRALLGFETRIGSINNLGSNDEQYSLAPCRYRTN